MLVKDCMTKQVKIGSPDMSLQEAAVNMRDGDFGVLPIGENDKLVGMVTDRDITIRATAENKDPKKTQVREVMTPDILYCYEDETLNEVTKNLGDNQIRRLPVLNRKKRLVGILSLGDVAQSNIKPEKVENALSRISKPTDNHFKMKSNRKDSGTKPLVWMIAGGVIGGAIAYFMDPSQGKRRRALIKDKEKHFAKKANLYGRKIYQDLKNRGEGIIAKASKSSEEVDDQTLIQRVRSEFGREITHPKAIEVNAYNGEVTLSGPILTKEVEKLISCVKRVPGVKSVINQLDVHKNPGNISALQGEGKEYLQ